MNLSNVIANLAAAETTTLRGVRDAKLAAAARELEEIRSLSCEFECPRPECVNARLDLRLLRSLDTMRFARQQADRAQELSGELVYAAPVIEKARVLLEIAEDQTDVGSDVCDAAAAELRTALDELDKSRKAE